MSMLSKKRLNAMPLKFKKGTYEGTDDAMESVEDTAKMFGGANQLKVRTGYLRRSIKSSVRLEGGKIVGAISSSAIYAAIHEYGGVITPKSSMYLRFKGDFGWAAVKSVAIPPRPFLRPAIIRSKKKIAEDIVNSINKEIRL